MNNEILIELQDISILEMTSIHEKDVILPEQLPETELLITPDNDEEKIVYDQANALRKFLPELFPKENKSMCFPPLILPTCKENTVLYIKDKQFKELNLTIGSVICLNISVFKGDE